MFASSSDSGPLGHCWPWTSQYYKCAWHIELALGVCLPSVEIPAAYVACVIDKVLAYKESCKPCVCPFICKHKPQFCDKCNNGWVPTLPTLPTLPTSTCNAQTISLLQ